MYLPLYRPSGIKFEIASLANMVPKIGDVITFHCITYSSNGIPVNPKLVAIRKDLTWAQVLSTFHQTALSLIKDSRKGLQDTSANKRKGYWTKQDTIRNFFDKMAFDRNLDPLLASTWRSISYSEIAAEVNFFNLNKKINSKFIN